VALSRGAAGVVGLSRSFRIMDDDGNHFLSYQEFKKGLRDWGFKALSDAEMDRLCSIFDRNGDGKVSVTEFLVSMRPAMNEKRRALVDKAWDKVDAHKDGMLTILDLEKIYNVAGDIRFIKGERTKDQLFKELLASFDTPNHPDGVVTKDEFYDYYSAISAGIDDDAHFGLIVRNAWKL
jgi:Ca2+-binding EF-hand superfamily protein